MKRIPRITWLLVGLITIAGCAQRPTRELDEADKAIAAASAADAPTYAPNAWSEAQLTNNKLQMELQAQDTKFALTRSYSTAVQLAQETKEAAEKAVTEAQAGREQVRVDASKSIEDTKALLEEVRQLVARAPQGKGTTVDLAAFHADTGASEGTLKDAENDLQAGRFQDAKNKAEAVRSQLQNIKDQIETAQKRVGRTRA